ncbi:Subtilisin-like protease SDD1 [Apostasia shenzhenica]|uniref:Subtilisin-like protease SDD1 n=1 Tax=Apostasia shenzhenica TaxID=1088818 RepID=A0A2H9ZY14_9ASPA|nr:Subtilisin-like protease SDD1 [Apostasia shenzhenica]
MEPHKLYFLFSLLFLLAAYLLSSFQLKPSTATLMNLINRNLPLFKSISSEEEEVRTYIVHVLPPENANEFLTDDERLKWHMSFLPESHDSSGEPRLIHSYSHAISGFAARLTPRELKAMEAKEGFLSAYPDGEYHPTTTHSPKFIGLIEGSPGLWRDANYGKGIIIGVVDSGINPTHPSFNDDGMDPVPPGRWKGSCNFTDPNHHCNKKIIGAKGFNGTQRNPPLSDDMKHGTKVASVAAGNFVEDAEVLNNAKGRAAGVAPLAYLAVYKVCFTTCRDSDVLAGINEAIKDGVDVLSISLANKATIFNYELLTKGAFTAVKSNIFASFGAGNEGPSPGTVSNLAPWVMTVGASTVDRTLTAMVKLGDGRELFGQSGYQTSNAQGGIFYPGGQDAAAKYCWSDDLPKNKVKNKIVLCHSRGNYYDVEKGRLIEFLGGAGLVLLNNETVGSITTPQIHYLPASYLSFSDSAKIIQYVAGSRSPRATIEFKGTLIPGLSPAPVVGAFSSRGPSNATVNGGILKPDIIAPGVNILVALPTPAPGPRVPGSSKKFTWASGTSYATPHISGVAALIKAVHPDWSPEAIKSAIMTTANTEDNTGKKITDQTSNPAGLFEVGAGHLDTREARDPGLVYEKGDAQQRYDDYVSYLCGLYENYQVTDIISSKRRVDCSKYKTMRPEELNYPSIGLIMGLTESSRKMERVVKNVGVARSTYRVKIVSEADEVEIQVSPDNLQFRELNERRSFEVTIRAGSRAGRGRSYEARMIWERELGPEDTGDKYVVMSPISVAFT